MLDMALQGPLKGRTHRYRNAGTETMNSKEAVRKAEAGFLQAATDTGAAALIVAAICAAPWAAVPRPVKGAAE